MLIMCVEWKNEKEISIQYYNRKEKISVVQYCALTRYIMLIERRNGIGAKLIIIIIIII